MSSFRPFPGLFFIGPCGEHFVGKCRLFFGALDRAGAFAYGLKESVLSMFGKRGRKKRAR